MWGMVYNKNVNIKFVAHGAFFGITFSRYAQSQMIGNQLFEKYLGAGKPKGLNIKGKIG